MTDTTESRNAFQDLENTVPHIIRGLEHGLMEARDHFETKSLKMDASAFSTITRLHAKHYLNSLRFDAEADVEMERVNLCGLWMKIGRYHLKIWKISGDDLTKALQREASGQQLSLVDDKGIPIVLDLAIFWTADRNLHLGEIYLVHPKDAEPRNLDWVWSRRIEQSVETVKPVPAGDIDVESKDAEIKSQR
jgi:hypothetical protein